MEFNNSNDNNGSDGQQQQKSARKRKINELANDPAAGEEDQPEPEDSSSKKNREEGNGPDLELESFSREELIKLVRKQMGMTKEAQKQLEASQKETEESQHKVKELTSEMAKLNAEYQKLLEIVQLPHEKEQEIADDAEKPMKIQLSLETWYDWLAFVPRHQLGKIIPMIADRKLASIVQKFLHDYGEITIDCIEIVAPYEEDPSGHPRVRLWPNNHTPLRFEMAEAQMPANIKNFNDFELKYFDQSVLNFMQKFKQNGLLDNANLWFDANLSPKDIVQPVLRHLLPLVNGIVSIYLMDSAQLVAIYDAENSMEIYEMNMKMMEETRILALGCTKSLHANRIDLYCRWLYQPARADGKPRLLNFRRDNVDFAPISLFIDRLKQDFLMATNSVTFMIRIVLPKAFQPPEAICLDNGKTKERFQAEMEEAGPKWQKAGKIHFLIKRHPHASTSEIVFGKEYHEKTIYLTNVLKVVPI